MVTFTNVGAYDTLCDTQPSYRALFRGPFSPAGIQWPPDLHRYITTALSINAPTSVKAGTTLVFYVTVSNQDTIDYSLEICPDYHVFLGAKAVVVQYMLNCGPVGRIPPGAEVKFEMKLDVPKHITPGPYALQWGLADFRITTNHTEAPFQVAP